MPAYAFEVDEAEAEGVALNLLTNPVRIAGRRRPRRRAWSCCAWRLGEPDASGRRQPVPVEGSNYQMEADTVILAIGQAPDLGLPAGGHQASRGAAPSPTTKQTLATTLPGVFAGGDAATGPRSAIEAVGMGHRAAESIHRYLSEETVEFLPHIDPDKVVALDRSEVAARRGQGQGHAPTARAHGRAAASEERVTSFRRGGPGLHRGAGRGRGRALPGLRRLLRVLSLRRGLQARRDRPHPARNVRRAERGRHHPGDRL